MSIRENLANGVFEENATCVDLISETIDYDEPSENAFSLKDMTRLDRMTKSTRARAHRHMVREFKQNKHQLGYQGSVGF